MALKVKTCHSLTQSLLSSHSSVSPDCFIVHFFPSTRCSQTSPPFPLLYLTALLLVVCSHFRIITSSQPRSFVPRSVCTRYVPVLPCVFCFRCTFCHLNPDLKLPTCLHASLWVKSKSFSCPFCLDCLLESTYSPRALKRSRFTLLHWCLLVEHWGAIDSADNGDGQDGHCASNWSGYPHLCGYKILGDRKST